MKKLLVALAALAFSTSAFAQAGGAGGAQGGQFGLGVSIADSIEILVPIKVAPNMRIEPTIAIATIDTDAGLDETNLTLGAGVFVQQRIAAPVEMYAGGRVRLGFVSVDDGTNDESGTDFDVAGAVGAEYYLVPKFSIGLEANLGFFSLSDVSGDASGFYTRGLGLLRMYF